MTPSQEEFSDRIFLGIAVFLIAVFILLPALAAGVDFKELINMIIQRIARWS